MTSTLRIALPAIAANAADSTTALAGSVDVGDETVHVAEAHIVLPAGATTIAASGTDHAVLTISRKRAGVADANPIATFDTANAGAGGLLAEVPQSFVLGSGDVDDVADDDVFDVLVHQAGAGKALPAGTVVQVDLS